MTEQILVPVSYGELVDKVTILRIKAQKITDPEKLKNIHTELEALLNVCDSKGIDVNDALTKTLEDINLKLWAIEDDIREKERQKDFQDEFIALARAVYRTNDERFGAKSAINEKYGSELKEEKSYKEY